MTNTFIIVNALAVLGGILVGAIIESKLSTRYWQKKCDNYLQIIHNWEKHSMQQEASINKKVQDVVHNTLMGIKRPEVIGEHIIELDEYDDRYAGWEMKHQDHIPTKDEVEYWKGIKYSEEDCKKYGVEYSAGTGHEDRRTPGDHQS